jgi:hypothetical protein
MVMVVVPDRINHVDLKIVCYFLPLHTFMSLLTVVVTGSCSMQIVIPIIIVPAGPSSPFGIKNAYDFLVQGT